MVELVKTFSFDEHVLPQIIEKRKRKEEEGLIEYLDDISLKKKLNARVVGQERDNAILFVWYDDAPDKKIKHLVTYIGQYEPSDQEISLLFIHDKKAHIVGASVNQERTLLAFTVLDKCFCPLEERALDPDHGGIYKSYLAEIHPYNRVFSLDVEKHFYQRVQFLYSSPMSYADQVNRKESHMLFFHHTESISLYHICMNKVGDKGMIMSSQPRKEPLDHKFIWLQWDPHLQRLYCIYRKSQTKGNQGEIVLGVYQFSDKPMCFTKVMELPLPSCMDIDFFKRPSYDIQPLSNVICDKSVNIFAVSLQGICMGSLFLCYQKPFKLQPVDSDSDEELSKEQPTQVDLEYSIFIVHHDHILHCALPLEVSQENAAKIRIHFNTFNEYLVVYIPGMTMHLLDMSVEHAPCHHIIFQGSQIAQLPEYAQIPSILTHINKLSPKTNGTNIFDSKNCIGYKMVFNRKSLVEVFARSHLPTTRLALLHLILVHLKDILVMRKMFEHLCCDPSSPECTDLLKEFLVCSTYGQMKRVMDRDVLKLLPLTCVDTFRGHLEKSPSGKRLARITYSPCKVNQECILVAKGPNKRDFDFWLYLRCRNNCTEQRFSLSSVAGNDDEEQISQEANHSMGVISSMIRHLSGSAKRRSGSSGSVRESSVEFLKSAEKVSVKEESRQNKLAQQLSTHLALYLPRESKIKLENIAKEYVHFQSQQSVQLLQLFWNCLGFSAANHPLHMHLIMQGSPRECALFQLLERYYTAVMDKQFPQPPGFQTFFTTVGFRCLSSNLFFQYVDNGVLKLKGDFLNKVLEDLGNSKQHSEIVFQILSRQKHKTLGRLLQQWDHPVSARCLSQRFVSRLLTDDEDVLDFPPPSSAFYGPSHKKEPDPEEHAFQPLVTLMEQLNKKVREPVNQTQNSDGRNRSYTLDLLLIEQSSLTDTQDCIGENLKYVTF